MKKLARILKDLICNHEFESRIIRKGNYTLATTGNQVCNKCGLSKKDPHGSYSTTSYLWRET